MGKQIAEYYQNLAWRTLSESPRDEIAKIVKKLKEQGRQAEISAAIANIPKAKVSKELAYLTGKNREDYLYDMGIAQFYASLNRQAIWDTILSSGLFGDSASSLVHSFETIHNYVDLESGILRKGAVSAQKGERLIIPINMRDGSLICIGKGNPEWNFSAPHGAGRLMSRAAAKERLTVEEFKKEMAGIFTTSVGYSTLDESPMAYKSMKDIVDNIHDTVEILEVVRPLYNFKAGE